MSLRYCPWLRDSQRVSLRATRIPVDNTIKTSPSAIPIPSFCVIAYLPFPESAFHPFIGFHSLHVASWWYLTWFSRAWFARIRFQWWKKKHPTKFISKGNLSRLTRDEFFKVALILCRMGFESAYGEISAAVPAVHKTQWINIWNVPSRMNPFQNDFGLKVSFFIIIIWTAFICQTGMIKIFLSLRKIAFFTSEYC